MSITIRRNSSEQDTPHTITPLNTTKVHETILFHVGCLVPFPFGRGENFKRHILETSISIMVCGLQYRTFSMNSLDRRVPSELSMSQLTATYSPTPARKPSKTTSKRSGKSKRRSGTTGNLPLQGLEAMLSETDPLNGIM